MINAELKRLAHLLNDIQDISNDAAEIATDFDIVLLLCDLVTLVRYQIAKTICLEVIASRSFMVHLPENTFRQAVLNLVLNAAEACSEKKSGHISINISKPKSGLIIQIFDNGAGFSKEFLAGSIATLAASQQDDAATGLVMSERFIKKMGGKIRLGNHFPYGACVTVLLPESCVRTPTASS